ncbi:MAG: hypothetical protein AAF456_23335 [Planctomycetota bacterium]
MPGDKVGPSRLAKQDVERVAGPPSESLIEVFCQSCGQGYRVKRSLAGQSGKCACGATFKIPFEPQQAPEPVEPGGLSDFSDITSGIPPAQDPFAPAPLPSAQGADPLAMDYEFDFDAPAAPPSAPPTGTPGLAPPVRGQAAPPPPAPVYQQPAAPPPPQPLAPVVEEVEPIAYAPPPGNLPPGNMPPGNPMAGGLPGDPLGDPLAGAGGVPQSYGAPAPAGAGYWNRPGTASLAGGGQKKSRRDAYKKSKKKKRKSGGGGDVPMSAIGNIGFGILLAVLGLGATAASYNMADVGEEYVIWYGPVIWGAIHFFAGVVQLISGD